MRTIKELIKYYFLVYFKSTKFVMPFVAMLIFLYSIYSTFPIGIVESYTVSLVIAFLIMIWVGLTYNSLLDQVSEQLLILKAQSMLKYYISKTFFLFILAIIVGTIMTMFPVIQNIINGFRIYNRNITVIDIFASLILHYFSGFVGGTVGSFLHQRIMRDRRLAIIITFGIAILALAKKSLNDTYAVSKFITWVLPPIADVMEKLSDNIYFAPKAVVSSLIYLLIYGSLLSTFQIFLLNKNKF